MCHDGAGLEWQVGTAVSISISQASAPGGANGLVVPLQKDESTCHTCHFYLPKGK